MIDVREIVAKSNRQAALLAEEGRERRFKTNLSHETPRDQYDDDLIRRGFLAISREQAEMTQADRWGTDESRFAQAMQSAIQSAREDERARLAIRVAHGLKLALGEADAGAFVWALFDAMGLDE